MAERDILNAKQERFCQLVVAGNSQAESYRQAYASRGNVQTCAEEGSRFMAIPYIRTRVKELRDIAISEAFVHLDGHLNKLKEYRDKAAGKDDFNIAANIEVNRAKACGLYTEKRDITSSDGSMTPTIDFSKLSLSQLTTLESILYPDKDNSNE